MFDSCSQERDSIRNLIDGAGMAFGSSRKGSAKVRLELHSPKVAVPLKINITELMAELLPDSPSCTTSAPASRTASTGACETSTTPAQASP